jgi:putative ABC transport system permease protein
MQLAEFAALGALCGAVAALCATICGWALAERVLHISYSPDPKVFLYGIAGGLAGVAVAGWLAVRGSRTGPPLKTLRALT